jgi:DMSO/TMAO reductase YedYZ heme-binding membrane subunit
MDKTIWFVHDLMYTSLQLLDGVGVEVLLLAVGLVCVLLLLAASASSTPFLLNNYLFLVE